MPESTGDRPPQQLEIVLVDPTLAVLLATLLLAVSPYAVTVLNVLTIASVIYKISE